LFAAIVIVGGGGAFVAITLASPPHATASSGAAVSIPTATRPPDYGFDRKALSIDDPTSMWLVVDKLRPLVPLKFVPSDLVPVNVSKTYGAQMRAQAASQLKVMFDAFLSEVPGRGLVVHSAYRSYETQAAVFDGDLTLSAKPGYSEHQSGMAVDIGAESKKCSIYECFAQEPEGMWLAANSYKYGFVLRYPKGSEAITGYQFEPWHFRYVGPVVANYMHSSGIQTLEEVFGLPAAPKYANQN
jgi:D-alanyl-D-alanine carboxypeptidase